MSANLMTHAGAALTSYNELAALPAPQPMGRFHKPIAHVQLVDTLHKVIDAAGLTIARQQFALQRDGASLFGVMDLQRAEALSLAPTQQALSIGFRNATNQALGIKLVAGSRVFVCDNLALSGDVVALSRKNTSGIDLVDEVRRGFDKFLLQAEQLKGQLQALAGFDLTDDRAKVMIFDAFAAGFLPSRLFDDVERFYFHADDQTPDCLPRTAWGLHNAMTRSIKALSPARQFEATQALGRQFHLQAGAGLPVLDVEAVPVAHA